MYLRKRSGITARKKVYVIWQKQLQNWFIVPSQRFTMYLMGHEPLTASFLKKVIKPGNVFIDVGSFIGFYSILAAKLAATVVSLEPDPRSFKILLYNIEISGVKDKIIPINVAAGSSKTFLDLKLASSLAESSFTNYLSDNKIVGVIKVPSITLDELFMSLKLNRVDVIKIDVEGAGLDVIKGAEHIISMFKPRIIFEVHRYARNDELLAIKILKERFKYNWSIIEFKSKHNFICHLVPTVKI